MNIVAAFHAYKFTHFANNEGLKTKAPEELTVFEKIKTLIVGVNNIRPANKVFPTQKYETIKIQSNKLIECWYIPCVDSSAVVKGTVVIFHGYGGEKSSMLDKSDEFLRMHYNTVLVDFMGSGGSEANQCTLGFKEAEQVKSVFEYLRNRGGTNIYLFGTSMGAVSILKAVQDYQLKAKGLILECPFGSMYQTTCARFEIMKVPSFPMAGLLVFWGGLENNFWAIGHRPTEYAKGVDCPTLLLYGEKDRNVSRIETDEIFKNLKGEKFLKAFKEAGHENFLLKYSSQWRKQVSGFLMAH